MKVRVLLFAEASEKIGAREIELELPDECRVQDVKNRLSERYPEAADLIERSVLSVNQKYATPQQEILPNSEVALIPPVSGG